MSERRNDFYDLPIVEHESVESFDPSRSPMAVHEVPIGDLVMSAMVRLEPADYLTVICHGSLSREKKELPFFQRYKTSLERPGAYMFFSDPVLTLDPTLKLAWFAGTETTELIPSMATMVRRVLDELGTRRVCFAGSSGGGFASLQLSSRIPRSLAYVWSPQTSIPKYARNSVEHYISVAFPGKTVDEVYASDPERFSLLERYHGRPLLNRIYYAQNAMDEDHVKRHFRPFIRSLGSETRSGIYLDGRVRVIQVNQGPGHDAPPLTLWHQHMEQALEMLP